MTLVIIYAVLSHFDFVAKFTVNNAITDGGVAPPPLLLTIVMMSSNLKSPRIFRNFKDSIEG